MIAVTFRELPEPSEAAISVLLSRETKPGRKVMLGACRSMANSNDILSDLNGEIAYVLRVPRIIPVYRAALRNSREVTAKKKAKRQQQRPDCHIDTPGATLVREDKNDCGNQGAKPYE